MYLHSDSQGRLGECNALDALWEVFGWSMNVLLSRILLGWDLSGNEGARWRAPRG